MPAKKAAAKPKSVKAVKPKVAKAAKPSLEEKKTGEVEVAKVVKQETPKKVSYYTADLPSLKDMLEAGVHFGHSVKRRNPRMDEYVYAVKNGVQIFDLIKTRDLLAEACGYLMQTVADGGQVLLVGTKGQAAETVKSEAERLGIPFITTRWVGGLFTNWEQLKNRITKLVDMRKKMEAGDYKKYTKKEQVLLKREIDRLTRMYGGLVPMEKLPAAIFIVDPTREITAVRESIARGVPIVAIADSNANPQPLARVIPANDDALKSVVMLVKAVTAAIEKGQAVQRKNTQTNK